jgi:hypothetical protein
MLEMRSLYRVPSPVHCARKALARISLICAYRFDRIARNKHVTERKYSARNMRNKYKQYSFGNASSEILGLRVHCNYRQMKTAPTAVEK